MGKSDVFDIKVGTMVQYNKLILFLDLLNEFLRVNHMILLYPSSPHLIYCDFN